MVDPVEAWKNLLKRVSPQVQRSYLNAAFPSDLDEEITRVVRAFEHASPNTRHQLYELVGREHSPLLLAYSERMASLAVREHDARRVLDGLLAIVIEGFEFDPRDSLMRLALLYHSAERVGREPRALFDAAASVATSDVAEALRGFTRERKPEDRTLDAMGYREAAGNVGPLVYERTP